MSLVRRFLVALTLLVVSGASAHAQQWSTYLHMKTCNDLIPLRDTVWVASADAGVLRYDRLHDTWATLTREPNGLANNNVTGIRFDRSGNLFCAVPGKGISRLDRDGGWTLINAFDGLPSDTVLTMRAQGDSIWIGTTRGLALWNGEVIAGSIPDRGTASPFVDDHINGIAIIGDTLWVSSPVAVYRGLLSQRLATWKRFDTGLPIGSVRNIRGIVTDGRDLLALASGLNPDANPANQFPVLTSFRWFPRDSVWISDFPQDSRVRRLRDDSGVILATTLGGVYRHVRDAAWSFLPGSPATDNTDIQAIEVAADPSGKVFASTGGVVYEQTPTVWTPRVPPGPVGNNCRNVMWANGSVYAVYAGEGLSRLRGGVWRNYRAGVGCVGAACDTTFSNVAFPAGLGVDRLGRKWVGNWAGPLTAFDDEVSPPAFKNLDWNASTDVSLQHLHSCIHAIASDSTTGAQAGMWMGLDSDIIGCGGCSTGDPQGIDLYDLSGNFIRNYGLTYPGLKNGLVRGLEMAAGTGEMWVGYKQNGLSTFKVQSSLTQDIVLDDVTAAGDLDVFGVAIHGDSVWVLASEGLRRLRASSRTLASSLPIAGPPVLAGMHPIDTGPDGTVYVGTEGGLRVHRKGVAPVDYTPDNSPLADLSVRAVHVDPTGVVWIATAGGVNRFDPNYVPPKPPRLATLRIELYPNPVWRTGLGFTLRLQGQGTVYDGEVLDLAGRVVHRFHTDANGRVMWDGRDLDGRLVGPGVYFVRARSGGAEATARLVVLH
jgi:hypothetical protein